MNKTTKVFVLFSVFFLLISVNVQAEEWEQIVLYSGTQDVLYKATSELENPDPDPFNPGTYSAVKIFDGDKATYWAEGVSGDGIGEAVLFQIPENTRILTITNGDASTEESFLQSNRVKKMIVSFYIGVSPEAHVSEMAIQYFAVKWEQEFMIELLDTYEEQEMSFPLSWIEVNNFKNRVLEMYRDEKEVEVGSAADAVHTILKLEIQDVFKGSEKDITCISEIQIQKDLESVRSVYISKDEGAVLIDANTESGIEIDRDNDAVFQIVNSTGDNQWVICIKMPREKKTRVETQYVLYNTFVPQKIEPAVLGEHVLDMYGFVKQDGRLFLEYFNSKTSRIEYLDLEEIELR
ncbi:MAG: hypothetical protein GF421_11715 [Candidatus Aminicenantes bacterium]|nr:hypothetical protein [Candidatus Aminicenantes bacterium]